VQVNHKVYLHVMYKHACNMFVNISFLIYQNIRSKRTILSLLKVPNKMLFFFIGLYTNTDTICAGRLVGAGCEYPKIERDGEKLERPMSSSGL
jgi:hypothetical protein